MNTVKVIYDAAIIKAITRFVDSKLDSDDLRVVFPNALLREDTLELLDRYCTVIYYPLSDEKNNGFHINVPQLAGGECHFVYINTAQTIEKQVFTAAHELGHIWEVDDYVARECNLTVDDELREQIINRFAAELLIPKAKFCEFFSSSTKDLPIDNGQITINTMFRLIAKMMNFFFVPMKSIVLRFAEFRIIDEDTATFLLGMSDLPESTIQIEMEQILKELGYTKLLKSTEKKWIEGLAEMLDSVEAKNSFPAVKIENIRKIFDLQKKPEGLKLDSTVELTVQEEDGICDENK